MEHLAGGADGRNSIGAGMGFRVLAAASGPRVSWFAPTHCWVRLPRNVDSHSGYESDSENRHQRVFIFYTIALFL